MKRLIPHLLTSAFALTANLAVAQSTPPPAPPAADNPPSPGAPLPPPRRGPAGAPPRADAPPSPPIDEPRPPTPRRNFYSPGPGGGGGGFGPLVGSGGGGSMELPAPSSRPQPFLGVVTAPVEPSLSAQLGLGEGLGLIVQEVVPESSAQKAGVQRHDVLKQINDQLLASPEQLATLVRHFGKDAEVKLTIIRKGQEQLITAKISEREMPPRNPFDDDDEAPSADAHGLGFGPPPKLEGDIEDFARRTREWAHDLKRRGDEIRSSVDEKIRRYQNKLLPPTSPDVLRQVAPGGAPEVKVEQDQSSTTWNTASARVTLKDEDGELDVRTDNGKRTLTAKNASGETVFNGPINSEEEQNKVPELFRKKLSQIDVRTHVEHEEAPAAIPSR